MNASAGPSVTDYFYERDAVPRYEEVPPFPAEVLLDITSFCNHACAFCSNPDIGLKTTVGEDTALRFLSDAHALGARRLGVFGTGESFLIKNLAGYVKHAKALGYEYAYVKTNGSLCTPERLGPVLDAGLDSLRVSIHAGTRETYRQIQGRDDFDQVLRNLKSAHEYRERKGLRARIAVSFVATAKGLPELDLLKKAAGEWVDLWDVQGLNTQCGNVLDNGGKGEVAFGGPRYDAVRGQCKLPFSGVSLTPEGFVSACIMDFSGSLIVGDYKTQALKDIWEGPVYRAFRRQHLDGALRDRICHACIHNEPTESVALMPELSRKARAARGA
jgi:MoaA/NifB/PqqE/SkfB family radical SAM enzyme